MDVKLLVGKPGIGKTYTAEQYALQKDLYLVEYNASDDRTALSLKDLSASQSITVSGKKIMYLFDEVDNMEKGGSKRLAEFLRSNKSMTIFLTANNLNKVSKEIQNECEVIPMFSKSQEEIEEILRDEFPDMLGFEVDYFEELVSDSAKRSKGDLRKAKQFMEYQNTEKYDTQKLDTLNAVKMILYEEDRKKVYDYIRGIPVSSLYSWLFETFAANRNVEATRLMQEINRNIYKLNEVYLYSFIAFELPMRREKLVERLPTSNKLQLIEEKIILKLQDYYQCSKNESLQYLNLIKTITLDKFCQESIADKCAFTKSEREHLGIKTKVEAKKEEEIAKPELKMSNLLQY